MNEKYGYNIYYRTKYEKWKQEDVDYLIKNFKNTSLKDLSVYFNKTELSISTKYRRVSNDYGTKTKI